MWLFWWFEKLKNTVLHHPMKTKINTKIALIIGGSCCLFMSSCAMSKKEAGKRGAPVGAVIGGGIGWALGEKRGRTKADRVKAALLGAGAGAGAGKALGENISTLDGIEDVLIRH